MRLADGLGYENDAGSFQAEYQKMLAVTPADVKRVAQKYLTANRTRLDVNPGPPTPRAPEVAVDPKSQPPMARPPAVAIKDTFDRSVMPKVGDAPKFTPPPVVRRTLSNGLEVLVAERHGLPILSLNLVVKGGEALVPDGKEGLASMTAELLTEGTKSRNALELAGALSEIGASMMVGGNIKGSTRTLTTAMVLETGKGNFEIAIALALLLLALVFAVNWALTWIQQRRPL